MIVLLPNQLFPENELPENEVTLIEHEKYFQSNFHSQKLILHRASMEAYSD